MSGLDSFDPPEANPDPRRGGPTRPPQGPGAFVWASIRMGWRWLTRMKTALLLLAGLGVLSLVATVVPQEPNVPTTVRAWRAGTEGPGRAVSTLIDGLGAYDMYGAPIFLALLMLLFLSLTACLIPRVKAWWKLTTRGRPPATRHLDTHPEQARFTTRRSPVEVEAIVREELGGRRFRLRDADADARGRVGDRADVAAEKGIVSREGGSLAFHLSFYVLLIAVVLGQLLGFQGQVGIVEGRAFTDTQLAYWNTTPGRWWTQGDHTGFTLELDQFNIDWVRDPRFAGTPSLFQSDVTITRADGTTFQDTVGGNDPLVVDGMKIHQLQWGYAPRVVVEVDGEVVHDAFLTAIQDNGFFRTAVKAPRADPDVGLGLQLFPTAVDDQGNVVLDRGLPWADAPLLVVDLFRGDLRLDRAQNVNRLDTTGLELTEAQIPIAIGQTFETEDGVRISFPELRRWVGFQVSNRPTAGWLLLGAALMLVGLVPALYAYRRRIWVRAERRPDGDTLVMVAGRAFQRPQAFEDEFADLVERLRRATGTAEDPPDEDPGADPSDGHATAAPTLQGDPR